MAHTDDNLISDSGLFNWNSSLKKEEKLKMLNWFNNLSSEEKQYVMDFRTEATKDEYDTYDEEL